MGNRQKITIGELEYANAWPLFHHLDVQGLNTEIVRRLPSDLNRMLEGGELQLSAISSYAYAKNSEDLLLLPGLSVGTVGRVNSLFLFLKEPMERVRPERIAVTTTSATTVNLLKILMALHYDCQPEYEPMAPSLGRMLEKADGALLIGDHAIKASFERSDLHRIDLGALWHRFTGLGMTYAVVAVRKEAAAAEPEAISAIYRALLAGKRKSLSDLKPIVERACRELGGDADFWNTYFSDLQYDFGPMLQEGLLLYFRYARRLGLLEREVELSFFEERSVNTNLR